MMMMSMKYLFNTVSHSLKENGLPESRDEQLKLNRKLNETNLYFFFIVHGISHSAVYKTLFFYASLKFCLTYALPV